MKYVLLTWQRKLALEYYLIYLFLNDPTSWRPIDLKQFKIHCLSRLFKENVRPKLHIIWVGAKLHFVKGLSGFTFNAACPRARAAQTPWHQGIPIRTGSYYVLLLCARYLHTKIPKYFIRTVVEYTIHHFNNMKNESASGNVRDKDSKPSSIAFFS